MIDKNAYYLNFNTEQFLGAKELLKSMPAFFNRIYFCSKYGNALWTGEKEETFSNVAMICKLEDIDMLRGIIKNNFLHIQGWDSIKFTEKADYGFSFVVGNIQFILMPFRELENSYHIRYYDVNTGMCYDINMVKNKQFFLDSSINSNGEFVRLCDFNLEEINESNSQKFMAEKKLQPQMAVVDNHGYALKNSLVWISLVALSLLALILVYLIVTL